jgi:hypothetical protein
MSSLIVTNDYSDLANQRDIQDKPWMKAIRFAANYKSKLSVYNNGQSIVIPRNEELYHNRLAESSTQTAVLGFQSKELLNSEKFKDPYGVEFKRLLWDMYCNDYIAAEAVNIKNWAAHANQTQVKAMPVGRQVYESEEDLQKALDKTGMDEDKRAELVEYVETVDRITGMSYYKQDLAKQATVGGRAALFVETFEDEDNGFGFPLGTPGVLKPLHWSYLNQVRVDTGTWKFQSVRYTDFETQDDPLIFIPSSKLIYVTRNDHMITPNNLFYGLSDFHSIWKISNIIRQCEEVDIPEIVTSMWAQAGYFKFSNMNTNEMDKFMESIGPGLYRGFNNRIEYVPVPLKHDGWFIITLLQNMISHMLMKLRVPEFLYSMSKATSRSAVEIEMNVFRDIVLANERWWLERHLQEQWYSHLVGLFTKEMDPRKHKIMIQQQYAPFNFEDILAKANSMELLARRFFIDRYEGRQMIGLPPHNKNLDKNVNEIGQLKDLSPVDKLNQEHADKMQKQKDAQAAKQTTMDSFGKTGGQKGFTRTAPTRTNSAPIGTVGAGRGNKT